MRNIAPRKLRIAVAIAVFTGLTFAFAGFHGPVAKTAGRWLASTQFVASLQALATGASISAACILIVIATLLLGRVYCAAICPLGILQDIVARFAAFARRRKAILRYARPLTWIRQGFLWGSVIAILVGWGGVAISLFDPYSNFGRIISVIFRPIVDAADGAVVKAAQFVGLALSPRVGVPWGGTGVIALPAAVLSLIVVLSAVRGRLYCNTVCPVGTLLGFFSRWAAFRVTIEKSTCQKCGECLRACKAQCIDLRNGTIDQSRCVACYDCFGVCDNHSIGYRFAWKRTTRAEVVAIGPSIESEKQTAASLAADAQRRTFIAGATVAVMASLGGAKLFGANETSGPGSQADRKDKLIRPVCPPGSANMDRFLDRCTACQLCVSACPTNVLQPAFREYGLSSLLKPRLDFNRGACDFDCRRCGEVCPSGAIGLLDLAEKQITRIGVVHFEATRCLVQASGKACTACSDKCPTKAIQTVAFSGGLRLPTTQPLLCIGCGNCEHVCPTAPVKAITVIGRRWHNHARKAAESPGTLPTAVPPDKILSSGSTLPRREPVIMSVS